MNDDRKQPIPSELAELRQRVAELEKALQEKETEAAAILEVASLGIYECDTEGRITFVNPSQEKITGYTAEELLGTHIWDRLEPGPQKDSLASYLKRLIVEQPRPTPFFGKNTRKNGESFHARLDWSYNRDSQGQVAGFVSILSDITEQKRAEEEVATSKAVLEAAIESLPFDFWAIGLDGRYMIQNSPSKMHWGNAVGKRPEEVAKTPECLSAWLDNDRRALAGEKVEEEDKLEIEGEKHFYHTVIAPFTVDGRIQGILGANIDITGRKRAEAALQEAHNELERRVEERTIELTQANEKLAIFRRFVEAAGEGFGMSSFDGQIIYTNPSLCHMLAEERPEDVIGKHLSWYFGEDYLRWRETEILPSILKKGHWRGELVIPRQSGAVLALQDSFLVHDEHGNPAYLSTVLTDITERKQAEEALRQSRDELQTIYDEMVEGCLCTNIETKRFMRVNASMCQMLGYSEEELLAASLKDIHPPEEVTNELQRFQAVAEGQRSINEDRPVLRKDGSVFYADITGRRILYDGQPCLLALFRDVTERRQAQEALKREHRAIRHLLQSSDHERQLIAYEIHDGLAQYLAGAIMQFEVYRHLKATKPNEAGKAYDAGMTMLRQSHFEARRLISGVRPPILDESGVVAAIAHLVNEERRQNGPTIEFHSDVAFDRLIPILENAAYRIIQEGLTNACKHSKSQRVRVELVQHGEDLRIKIQDWGVGFDPSDVEEDRFGLPGIRERARLLGGNATVESTPEHGTCILVELPLAPRQ